ncbi:MAG TPA: hypothetical protein VGM76_12595 [Lacipirellulaceae bacterium]|jgi:hypothetical protein
MTNWINMLTWDVIRLADSSPMFHFFGLLARGHDKSEGGVSGPSGPPAYGVSWALMLFCAILGLMVTLTPIRRSIEVKRPKDE